MKQAVHVKADGVTARLDMPPPGTDKLKWMQDKVGGYIQLVHTDEEYHYLVNEDGLRLNLPPNFNATSLIGGVVYAAQAGIVGDMLMVPLGELD